MKAYKILFVEITNETRLTCGNFDKNIVRHAHRPIIRLCCARCANMHANEGNIIASPTLQEKVCS